MKNKGVKLRNDVWLDENISISTNKAKASSTAIIRCIALLLCIFSVLLTLKVTIEMPINLPIIISAVSFAILFTFINYLNYLKKFKFYIIFNLVFLAVIVVNIFRNDFIYGLQIIRSNFMNAINKYYYTNYISYDVNIPFMHDYERAKTILMIALCCIISLYFAFAIKRKRSLFPILILFSALFWGAVNFGVKPHTAPILLMLFAFMSIYALESQSHIKVWNNSNSEFTTKTHERIKLHSYYSNTLKSSVLNRNWTSTLVLTMSLIILILMIFPQGSYKRNAKIEAINQDPAGFIQKIWDKVLTKGTSFESSMSQSGVGGGDLTSIDREGFLEKTHLKVTQQNKAPMLLKGYVGSVYESNRWSDLNQSVYDKNAEIFSNLESFGIYPHTIESTHLNSITTIELLENEVTVENIKANKKYAYVPDNVKNIVSDKKVFIKDTIVDGSAFDNKKYTFVSNLMLKWDNNYLNNIEINDGVKDAILAYDKFVYDNYLDMPSGKLQNLKADFKPTDDINEAVKKVNSYLISHAVYDLSPGKKPKGKDYIEYFLYENHRGYCSHFATAATMMFRAMGIPARYVEGYTVTQYDIDNRNSNGEIDIKDSNAHAWTEIYLPMFGWVSVDVTPGSSGNSIAPPATNVSVPEEMSSLSDTSSEVSSKASSKISSQMESSSNTVSRSSNISSTAEIDLSHKTSKVWIVFLLFLGVILSSLLALGLRYAIIRSKRQTSFNQKNVSKSIVSVYSYVEDILSFIGYSKAIGETELEFAKRVSRECSLLVDSSFIEATELALKAKFSNHSIDVAKLSKMRVVAYTLSKRVFGVLKFADKFKYWLIDNLK